MDPYAAAQTYPPPPPPPSSQIQPQNQDHYAYNQQYSQSQPYPYYPQIQQQYPNPNPAPDAVVYQQQPEQQEHVPIHPPGVPVQTDPYQQAYAQTHFQNDAYYPQPQPLPQPQQLSYPDASMVHQGQQWQQQGQTVEYGLTSLYPPNGQGPQGQHVGSGRGRGRGSRGGGSSSRGRGRGGGGGRGRGGKPSGGAQPKQQFMAWCELCRVDCNTLEILENHKNGKKHKKNLKIQEDLQKIAARKQQQASETLALNDGKKVEEQGNNNNGLKRKMRDNNNERKSAEPSKKPTKEIIPFICELCNVKCESGPTFDSHLKGKKHGFNLQRFQEQQATLGQAALQALYPALEAALIQALSQASTSAANGGGGLDQQLLQWLQPYLPQTQVTGPVLGAQGLTQDAPAEPQVVEPTVELKSGAVEGEKKSGEQVEVESKTEEAAKVENVC